MTPKEVVTRAIEFRRPPRLPIAGHGEEVDDFTHIRYKPVKPPAAEGRDDVDEWLCVWEKTDTPNMGQVKGHPLEDLERMREFPWPDADDPRRYEDVPAELAGLRADPLRREKYCQTGIFMILWERMHSLHGFENCMMDLVDDDPRLHELADRILEYDLGVVRNMHRICGDAIDEFGFTEDWGTQNDLQISPRLWRRFFFPRYKRLFAAIHACGWRVNMHSCGKINKALPGLIEAGLDTVNMQQPRTNGIEEIGRQFAGRICFATLCDIQKTLPKGDPDEIRAEAEQLMRTWGTPAGGFILGDYGDHAAIGAAPEAKRIMLEAFRELDPWKCGWK